MGDEISMDISMKSTSGEASSSEESSYERSTASRCCSNKDSAESSGMAQSISRDTSHCRSVITGIL